MGLAGELGAETETATSGRKEEGINERLFAGSEAMINPATLLLIRQGGWRERMKNEGDTFLHFFYVWMKYTDRLLGSTGTVPWSSISGYDELVSVVTKRLWTTSIMQYSQMMKKAAWAMLADGRHFSALVHIVFSKTRFVIFPTIIAT